MKFMKESFIHVSELSFNFHLKIQGNSQNLIASEFFYHTFQIAFGNFRHLMEEKITSKVNRN